MLGERSIFAGAGDLSCRAPARPSRWLGIAIALLIWGLGDLPKAAAQMPDANIPPILRGKWESDFFGLGKVVIYLSVREEGTSAKGSATIVSAASNKQLGNFSGTFLPNGEMSLKLLFNRDAFSQVKELPEKVWSGAVADSEKKDPSHRGYVSTDVKLRYAPDKPDELVGSYVPLKIDADKTAVEYDKTEIMPEAQIKLSRKSYVQECRDNGVPIPPKWGSAGWVMKGELNRVFDSSLPKTEVWVYSDPLGFCYALPRKNPDVIINLGIICQGKASGNACFWDNKKRNEDTLITGDGTKDMDPANIQGGDQLKENCTNCHRGDNAFLITLGTALDLQPGDVDPPRYDDVDKPPYVPIGQFDWLNPARNSTDALFTEPGSCTSCHGIPQVTKQYCGLQTTMVALGIMPPKKKPGDTKTDNDIKILKEECDKLP